MNFAINYSPSAVELFTQKEIRVDRFKIPDWPDLIESTAGKLPIYVHFGINAGSGDSYTTDWKLADLQARRTDTPFVNLHLAAKEPFYAPGDLVTPIDRMLADVNRAAEFFGRDRVIAENIPLGNPEEGFVSVCGDPAVVSRLVRETGVGFLLDLSHARVTAQFLGCDEREYISKLPVEKLAELHITGLGIKDGQLHDHMPMREQDWTEAQWALDRIFAGDWPTPKIVALEYGWVGERPGWPIYKDLVAEQAKRLYDMVHR